MTSRRIFALLTAGLGMGILSPRVTSALTVGELTELTGSPDPDAEQRRPAVAYDADNDKWVIVFEDYSLEDTNGADLRAVRVRLDLADPIDLKLDGSLIIEDSAGISILPTGATGIDANQRNPSVAYSEDERSLVVVWDDNRDANRRAIRGATLRDDLAVGDILVAADPTDELTDPAVAFAQSVPGRWLVAWQRSASTDSVQALRFQSDFTNGSVGSTLEVSGTQVGNPPRIAVQGNDFFVAWTGGGNNFVNSIDPAMGTLGTPVQVANTTPFKRSIDIGPIGTAQLYTVWEQVGMTSEDVFGDRLGVGNLMSAGPQGPISDAMNDQLGPRLASDGTGALVVWQDFRQGAPSNDAIFGARINANGTVRDTLGIELMDLPLGTFEQTVAKGAGDDYLVVAVRRQPNTSDPEERIFVRLVRDEDPAGTLDNEGQDAVPADGETPMEVIFGPATGPSPEAGVAGLDVAEGTLYTVEWTSQTVTQLQITPEDADGDPMNGHQIRALRRQVGMQTASWVAFEMTTCVMRDAQNACIQADKGEVELTVRSVEGTAMGTDTVTFENVPPVASNAVVVGMNSQDDMPRTDDSLVLTYDYFDINADPEMGTTINWRSGDPAPTLQRPIFQNMFTVPASALEKNNSRQCNPNNDQGERGDAWDAEVVPNDGDTQPQDRQPLFSNRITLQNTPPFTRSEEMTICRLGDESCPEFEAFTGSALQGNYRFRDPDAVDDEQPPEIRWFVQQPGQTGFDEVPALADQLEVPGDQVISGQQWRFSVRVNDGCTFSEETTSSATISISNTSPTAEATGPDMVSERQEDVVLDASASSDMDPNDVLTFQWTQTGGTPVQLDDPTSATPSFDAPSTVFGTSLVFEVVVSDGQPVAPEDERQVRATLAVQVVDLPDTDNDRLDDPLEAMLGTDPGTNDTDEDTLRDDQEVDPLTGEPLVDALDPLDADSDDDGIQDGDEGRPRFDNLADQDIFADPDGDGLPAVVDPDSDNDGIPDGIEAARTSPIAAGMSEPGGVAYRGTDGPFVADADPFTQTNPLSADTDGDGFDDGVEDANRNGRVDEGETDPNDPNDPGQACTGDGDCGGGQVCGPDGLCIEDTGPSECTVNTLEDQGLECCVDRSTPAEPLCQGGVESCPAGSNVRALGFCSTTGGGDGGDGGGCASVAPGSVAPVWMLLGGWAWGLSRRRRRRA